MSQYLNVMHRTIEEKDFENHNFKRNNIQNTHIQECKFKNCDFSRSSLVNLRISNCCFIGCKFHNADLTFCKISNCTFKDCDFSLTEMENNNIFKSDIFNTKFVGARLANNAFTKTAFANVGLNGSTTKFNCFEETTWENSIFGDCTIDYNIAIKCKFRTTKMNLETLGSVWGIQKKDLDNVTFLSLGREIIESQQNICKNYIHYLHKKNLILEIFTFNVSYNNEDIYTNSEQLLNYLDACYTKGHYLSPDELHYFYEILKSMRKESMLPLLILKQMLVFFQELIGRIQIDENYYETILLFYNNICLIYNSMIHELSSYQYELPNDSNNYKVKIVFKEKPSQDVVQTFDLLYQYVYNTTSISDIKFVKDAKGSYIIWIIMPLVVLAAFNIGTLLLTGGVKNLIKLRATTEVLFSKKLPRKYYLDVYKKDDSEELAKEIISKLLTGNISSLLPSLRGLSFSGINAQNIQEISVEKEELPN